MASAYVVEHLNHLGIVAAVCREIGVAEWLDQQEPGNRQQVSVGTATGALVLNGLGFSNRQLYLVPQFFADKPVEHLLGAGIAIAAEDLNDDCLGRTLDGLYEQDVTRLFAGLALRARRTFGLGVARLHADTTSFSVHGQYEPAAPALATPAVPPAVPPAGAAELPAVIEVTYGYSRDHREDLKQWMVALVTSGEGVPQFLRPLDGNASDKRALLEAVTALTHQLQDSDETPGVYVADSGLYSTENMTRLNQAGVRWVSRVPETSTAAQAIVHPGAVGLPSGPSGPSGPRSRTTAGRRRPRARGTGGVASSLTCRKAPNAGSSCAPRRARNARGPRRGARRSGTRSPGRNACGIWATRPLPVSPTLRRRSPRRVSASLPGSRSSSA